jgi:BirA family transcriptional regulator, biotin operon repressor / biotin---[acetyl-CoA-carboxylase] ligase
VDHAEVSAALSDIPLGGLRFFPTVGSTNDEALAWAAEGARDLSVVIADEQTAGRGRGGRKWYTARGSALAVSMVLRPSPLERTVPTRMIGLGALAIAQCCRTLGLDARIKWPNDVLLGGQKVAGMLMESTWAGNSLDAVVLGMGLNVAASALPPAEQLNFPATSLEHELGTAPNRLNLLTELIAALVEWRGRISTAEFIQTWENALAFRGEQVWVGMDQEPRLHGRLLGLEMDGSLRLMSDDMPTIVHVGEIHLRPGDDRIE